MAVNAINSSGCDETPPLFPHPLVGFRDLRTPNLTLAGLAGLHYTLGQGADTAAAAAAANAMPYLFWHVKAHPAVL